MKLTVQRSEANGQKGPAQSFEVPEFEGMTVLDALMWVRQHVDPSLSFRYSCRNANACKECVAMVNGKMTYLCTSPAKGEVQVAPLPHKALVRDLTVEM